MSREKDINNIKQAIYYIDHFNNLIKNYKTEEDFLVQDDLRKAGLAMGLATVCEYANKVSIELKQENPHIPWRIIGDQRNLISHNYGRVSYKSVWKTFKEDIPVLKEQLEEILEVELKLKNENIKDKSNDIGYSR